jgi:hypothetical protein
VTGGSARFRLVCSAAALATLAIGCGRARNPSESAWLVVSVPPDRGIDVAHVRAEGKTVLGATLGSTLAVEIDARPSGDVVVRADGACPLRVPAGELRGGATVRRTLTPWWDFGEPQAEVGFDAPLDVAVQPGCPEARAGSVAWRQVSGAPLRDTHVLDSGWRFTARTARLEDALGGPPSWGVVPLSPRTRGEAELEATWSAAGKPSLTRRVSVSAAARARGLPNVVAGARLYLGGNGWHVVAAPPESHARVTAHPGFAALAPDVRGTFTLGDEGGRVVRLFAGKYDETPLDCGRSDCHVDIARVARSSPMATILQRGLDAPFGGDYPACALGCHAVGEPGLDDGGFAAVAHALGRSLTDLAHGGFHDLPAPLQRLGGVGCLGCHGPGAIPEPSGRHALLRSDVCATCHDAPPRYGHVAGWRASRMARADADPRTREEPCARCHTTWGALGRSEWRPPAEAAPAGIACAACHAVHSTSANAPTAGQTCAEALPRDVAVPALFADSLSPRTKKSRVCLACHAPLPDDATPTASASAIWAGRGGLDPATGAPLVGNAPHGDMEGGCVGCHREGPPGVERGANHAFQARQEGCIKCHAEKSEPHLYARAEALWTLLRGAAPKTASRPLHADGTRFDRSTPRGRAQWNVALVLEDRAADAHNAPYARLLLDAAERTLGHGRPSAEPTGGR